MRGQDSALGIRVAAEHRVSPAPGARMRSLAMLCLDSCLGRGVDCSGPPPPLCQGHETGANVLQSSGYTSPARYVSQRAPLALALCGMAAAPARSYRHGTRLSDVLRGGPPKPETGQYGASPPRAGDTPRSRPRMEGEEPRSPPRGEALSWFAQKFLGDLTAAASGTCITTVLSASKPVPLDVGGD